MENLYISFYIAEYVFYPLKALSWMYRWNISGQRR